MFKRYELHNHTTESDANITCRELVDIMLRDKVDAFALTDHNTISGHRIIRKILQDEQLPIACIYGMEYTTYYGHILCLNLHKYVPWDTIDRRHPEKLFEACRAAGAVTGIAHPFSFGHPFARGCRFDMTVTDFTCVDFIEVFNNPEPLEVNAQGLAWWEKLVLSGERLAATAGMDLHGDNDMSMRFATYVESSEPFDPADDLARAILSQRTWVSKGMLVARQDEGNNIRFHLEDAHKPGYNAHAPYILTLTDADGEHAYPIDEQGLTLPKKAAVQIPKLYAGEVRIENLVCVAPPIFA